MKTTYENPELNDTDSIITDIELPEDLVDPIKLGKLKLEHIIIEGYFIADKFYAFKTRLRWS